MELPWCPLLECRIWVDLTLSGISLCLLGIGDPWNPSSWVQKVLTGHYNRVPKLFPW